MNRRSVFALLPALPFVVAAGTQPSRRVHIHGRAGPFDEAQFVEQMQRMHRQLMRAGMMPAAR